MLDLFKEYLPFLLPLLALQLGLMLAAVIHILRHKTYRTGTRTMWLLLAILINLIGPILYFALGRGDE